MAQSIQGGEKTNLKQLTVGFPTASRSEYNGIHCRIGSLELQGLNALIFKCRPIYRPQIENLYSLMGSILFTNKSFGKSGKKFSTSPKSKRMEGPAVLQKI